MTNKRKTFKEIQAEAGRQMDHNLMAKGRQASQLAKHATGSARRRLYQVKHRALAHLIKKDRARVHVDNSKCPGLLSIRVHAQGSLHSHEGWLEQHMGRDIRVRRSVDHD